MPNRIDLPAHYLALLQALLATHVPEAEVWAFGSRVTGQAHQGSDLDLVVRNPNDLTAPVAGWHDLKEAIQQSTLPILVDVHDWAHLPKSFHQEIAARYVVLQHGAQAADPAKAGRAGV
ncbi:MAG: nucleotidyltransferase domain-containing protein [Gallionellaceae bacterium]|nr:MAG: nucleotidyltransferase domain-containing protein [Gallionellaceae bacterium]